MRDSWQVCGVLVATLPVNNRRREVAICPAKYRKELMHEKHRITHLGVRKTTQRIQLDWYWPGMHTDIRRYVSTCERCQKAKVTSNTTSNSQYHLYAGRPWQTVAIDLCGPFPRTPRGNTQILVLTDHFTRWQDALPLSDGKAETVAQALEDKVFAYLGIPEEIHSDQGRQFESQLFHELCMLWGTRKTRTSPYRPPGNSVVERLNRTLGSSLRALLVDIEQTEWDILLPALMRGIRATPHSITKETPNYLMLGRELRLPDAIVLEEPPLHKEMSTDYALALQDKMRKCSNQLRNFQYNQRQEETEEPNLFVAGDQVWLKNHQRRKGENPKLAAKYFGPCLVIDVLPYHTYRVRYKGKESIQHEHRLKLFVSTTSNEVPISTGVTHNSDVNEEPPTLEEVLNKSQRWASGRTVESKDYGVSKVKSPCMPSTLLPKTPGRKGDSRATTKQVEAGPNQAYHQTQPLSDSQVLVKTEPFVEEDCVPILPPHTLEKDGQPREGSNKATKDHDDSDHPTNMDQESSLNEPLPANLHARRPIRMRGAPRRLTDYSVEL